MRIMFNKYIIIVATALLSAYSSVAQVNSPVKVETQIVPPITPYMLDYVNGNLQKLYVNLLLTTDATTPTLDVKLHLTIESNSNNIRIETTKDPVVYSRMKTLKLERNVLQIVNVEELREYFDIKNLVFTGTTAQEFVSSNGLLGDGVYKICFDAYARKGNDWINVSNALSAYTGCKDLFISYNDPPLLNTPAQGVTIASLSHDAPQTQNIVFSWIPRQPAAMNSVYSLEIFEIPPGYTGDPNVVVLSSTPRFTKTVYGTTFDFNTLVSDGFLMLPNRDYAYRVKIQPADGTDPYAALTGSNLFKNNGYSEVRMFHVAGPCVLPNNIDAEVKGEDVALINYSAVGSNPDKKYIVRYRKEGVALWQEEAVEDATAISIVGLKKQTSYEYMLSGPGGTCFSSVEKFTTSNKPANPYVSCGAIDSVNDLEKTNMATLAAGNIFKAGSFTVMATTANGSNGVFNGAGHIAVPLFYNAGVKVNFNNVHINAKGEMYQGVIETSVGDIKALYDFTRPEDNFTFIDADAVGGKIVKPEDIVVNPTEKTVTLTVANADGTTSKKIFPFTPGAGGQIKDAENNVYTIDKDGKVSGPVKDNGSTGTGVDRPSGTGEKNGTGGNGETIIPQNNLPLNTQDAEVLFENYNAQHYGYDANSQYGPWKSMQVDGLDDKVKLIISIKNASVKEMQIKYLYKGQDLRNPFTDQAGNTLLTIPKTTLAGENAIYAYYLDGTAQKDTIRIGKLVVKNYALQTRKIVLVPMDETASKSLRTNADIVKYMLVKTYNQAIVNFEVTAAPVITEIANKDWDAEVNGIKDGKLDIPADNEVGCYTAEMQDLVDILKTKYQGYKAEDYYVFVGGKDDEATISAAFPRHDKFGFVFSGQGRYFVTLAHEIGHGIFHLDHSNAIANNLMNSKVRDNIPDITTQDINQSRSNNTSNIVQPIFAKEQWDNIRKSLMVVRCEDAVMGDDAAANNNCFMLVSNMIHLPWIFRNSKFGSNNGGYWKKGGATDGWWISNGGASKGVGNHYQADKYADDWVRTTERPDQTSGWSCDYVKNQINKNTIGQNVLSPIAGYVIYAGDISTSESGGDAYGNQIIIKSRDGKYAMRFAHLSSIDVDRFENANLSKKGQAIEVGSIIGKIGASGLGALDGNCGPTGHLHVAMYFIDKDNASESKLRKGGWLQNENVAQPFIFDLECNGNSNPKPPKNDDKSNPDDLVFGIDISANNGTIDFSKLAKVKVANKYDVKFVYIKRTQGADCSKSDKGCTNEIFDSQYLSAKQSGMKVGAYHYLDKLGVSGAAQFNWFQKYYDYSKNIGVDLIPVVDAEMTKSHYIDKSELNQHLKDFLDAYYAYYKNYPVVYTSPDVRSSLTVLDDVKYKEVLKWVAAYKTEIKSPSGNSAAEDSWDPNTQVPDIDNKTGNGVSINWDLWQFTQGENKGFFNGAKLGQGLDVNVYKGDYQSFLNKFVGAGAIDNQFTSPIIQNTQCAITFGTGNTISNLVWPFENTLPKDKKWERKAYDNKGTNCPFHKEIDDANKKDEAQDWKWTATEKAEMIKAPIGGKIIHVINQNNDGPKTIIIDTAVLVGNNPIHYVMVVYNLTGALVVPDMHIKAGVIIGTSKLEPDEALSNGLIHFALYKNVSIVELAEFDKGHINVVAISKLANFEFNVTCNNASSGSTPTPHTNTITSLAWPFQSGSFGCKSFKNSGLSVGNKKDGWGQVKKMETNDGDKYATVWSKVIIKNNIPTIDNEEAEKIGGAGLKAPMDGIVLFKGVSDNKEAASKYGLQLIIYNEQQQKAFRFGYLKGIDKDLKEGRLVIAGTSIGTIGKTGVEAEQYSVFCALYDGVQKNDDQYNKLANYGGSITDVISSSRFYFDKGAKENCEEWETSINTNEVLNTTMSKLYWPIKDGSVYECSNNSENKNRPTASKSWKVTTGKNDRDNDADEDKNAQTWRVVKDDKEAEKVTETNTDNLKIVAPLSGTIIYKDSSAFYGNSIVIQSAKIPGYYCRIAFLKSINNNIDKGILVDVTGGVTEIGATGKKVFCALYKNIDNTALENLKNGKGIGNIDKAADFNFNVGVEEVCVGNDLGSCNTQEKFKDAEKSELRDDPNNVIIWPFEQPQSKWNYNYSFVPGGGDHKGGDYWANDFQRSDGKVRLNTTKSKIYAPFSGKVVFENAYAYVPCGGQSYGRRVIIQSCKNLKYYMIFTHMTSISVKKDDLVIGGQTVLGFAGNSGQYQKDDAGVLCKSCEDGVCMAHIHAALYYIPDGDAHKDFRKKIIDGVGGFSNKSSDTKYSRGYVFTTIGSPVDPNREESPQSPPVNTNVYHFDWPFNKSIFECDGKGTNGWKTIKKEGENSNVDDENYTADVWVNVSNGNINETKGKSVLAPFNGKVIFANKTTANPKWGNQIIIQSTDADSKDFIFRLAHVENVPEIIVNKTFVKGVNLGNITGNYITLCGYKNVSEGLISSKLKYGFDLNDKDFAAPFYFDKGNNQGRKCIVGNDIINTESLKDIFPNADINILGDFIKYLVQDDIKNKHNIDKKCMRLAHFIAQCAEETWAFARTDELFRYTELEKISAVFGNKPNFDMIAKNSNNYVTTGPEDLVVSARLANVVYGGNRNGLGNGSIESGDGFAYRGSGFIQLTGKYNFKEFQDWYYKFTNQNIDFVKEPNLVRDNHRYSFYAAYWYYVEKNNLNEIADRDDLNQSDEFSKNICSLITAKINNGLRGLEKRQGYLLKLKEYFKSKSSLCK